MDRDKVKLREWVVRKHAQGWSLDEIAGHASTKEHMPEVDFLGKARQNFRGPIQKAKARKEDEQVNSARDHHPKIAFLVGSRQDQGMA